MQGFPGKALPVFLSRKKKIELSQLVMNHLGNLNANFQDPLSLSQAMRNSQGKGYQICS